MKVYLAAAFSRQREIKSVSDQLQMLGVEVTSRWLTAETIYGKPFRLRTEDGFNDIRDLRAADILIRFTDQVDSDLVPSRLISCARMFEFGMAWERGMPIFVVGGRQNVFDYLPNVVHFPDNEGLFEYFRASGGGSEKFV